MSKNFSGLSSIEVKQRIENGQSNKSKNLKTKSYSRIFYDNIITLFNIINVILMLSLIFVGSYKNILFMGVVISNTIIGIFHEIRSKINVDKLSIINEKKISVLRDKKILDINKDNIVIDDIIILSRGSQIPADCVVIDGNCKVNESLLTGESNLIEKNIGSKLLSGSFINSGKCYANVINVGENCYANKINADAKYIKGISSNILKSFNFIIKLCTFILFPIGIFFFIHQYNYTNGMLQEAVVSTVAALLGMIPKGMILLASSVMAVSVIRLSKQKIFVQEMYCIETLARVDVLCLDKTGTLTTDEMEIKNIIAFDTEENINCALSSIINSSEEINSTLNAIKKYVKNTKPLQCKKFISFSSETKWSGGEFENNQAYVIGATEFIFKNKFKYNDVYKKISEIKEPVRILVLAKSSKSLTEKNLPNDLKPMALLLIKDKLRKNVKKTIDYFNQQGVELKVISGDSVKTVQNIAKEVGILNYNKAVDMSCIIDDDEIENIVEQNCIFARVTPYQKKKIINALKKQGHYVAMTGDGVNDVLALKEADCSIAMASGSDAARNVSQIVITNNDFSAMPNIVAEGRRTINNLEISSSLYLVKTIYSIALSIFFIFFNMSYPFEPIQLSLIGALTVGLPSFVLALQPNTNIVKGNFTKNIFARALPSAICTIANIILISIFSKIYSLSEGEFSTICVYLTALSSFLLILKLSYPFNLLRIIMLCISVGGLLIGFLFFSTFFSLTLLTHKALIICLSFAIITIIAFNVLFDISKKYILKI